MLPFYTPSKHQKIKGFLVFSGGMKWEHWSEMDESGSFYAVIFLAGILFLIHLVQNGPIYSNVLQYSRIYCAKHEVFD